LVKHILNSRKHRRSWQYLVRWVGYGQEHNRWLAGSSLSDCEALNIWEASEGV
jgi:hypothetical protein